MATKVKTFIGVKAQTLMHIAIQEILNPSCELAYHELLHNITSKHVGTQVTMQYQPQPITQVVT
jgi:hypothetical protein